MSSGLIRAPVFRNDEGYFIGQPGPCFADSDMSGGFGWGDILDFGKSAVSKAVDFAGSDTGQAIINTGVGMLMGSGSCGCDSPGSCDCDDSLIDGGYGSVVGANRMYIPTSGGWWGGRAPGSSYMDQKQRARLLGRGPPTVYKLQGRGGPYYKVGGKRPQRGGALRLAGMRGYGHPYRSDHALYGIRGGRHNPRHYG